MNQTNDNPEKKRPMVSIQGSSIPSPSPIKITRDGSFARIVIYEKEDLSCEEICQLLNIGKYTKVDLDKHYERKDCQDKHIYTVYNVLI